MQEIDLYRAALEMIKQHGNDAGMHAAMKSDKLMDKGDMVGAKIWREIVKKVDVLQSETTGQATRH